MSFKPFGACLIVGGLVLAAIPTIGHTASSSDELRQCKALASEDFARIPDAPAQITEAVLAEPAGRLPGYCQVSGYVAPNVGFIARLPLSNWNRKFLEQGCGGYCGTTKWILACDEPLGRGYACIVSNMGHTSTDQQALWAYNNLQADVDHAYRSAHVTALVGKAIVERYYGQSPRQSYFTGCSTGGREAMVEAQRFPWDFNGIIAASPSLGVPAIHMSQLWANRAMTDANGQSLFSKTDLALMHEAALKRCDTDDNVRDGLISNPLKCDFDPSELLCTAGKNAACLAQQQVDAARKIYSGPRTSRGEQIYLGGAMKGSEGTWLDSFIGPADDPRRTYKFVGEEFRYSAFQPSPGPSWKPEDFDFDRDYKRMGGVEGLFSATNPDLRKFKQAGGKLLMYIGWNDSIGLAFPPVDYYETAERTMGGRAATQEFFRLFALPGVNHCAGGDGASAVDYLSYLETWVEKGLPPSKLLAYHVKLDDLVEDTPKNRVEYVRRMTFPLDLKTVEFSRPVYPYPTIAKYLGQGDPRDLSNFGPSTR